MKTIINWKDVKDGLPAKNGSYYVVIQPESNKYLIAKCAFFDGYFLTQFPVAYWAGEDEIEME